MSLDGCDTLIATPGDTTSGNTIFAKNSDRPPTETQPLVKHDRKTHGPNTINKLEFLYFYWDFFFIFSCENKLEFH